MDFTSHKPRYFMYCGARVQKHVPAKTIKLILGLVILFLPVRYITSIF